MTQEPKSIFKSKFHYVKIPASVMQGEILSESVLRCNPQLDRLSVPKYNCPEGIDFGSFFQRLELQDVVILGAVIYWTRKGFLCTYTNKQFGELINRCERTANGVIAKLIRHKLVNVVYLNDHRTKRKNSRRQLIALVGIKQGAILKCKAKQVSRATDVLPRNSVRVLPRNSVRVLPRNTLPSTTNIQLIDNYAAAPLAPPEGASPPRNDRIPTTPRHWRRAKEKRARLSENEFENRRQQARQALMSGE